MSSLILDVGLDAPRGIECARADRLECRVGLRIVAPKQPRNAVVDLNAAFELLGLQQIHAAGTDGNGGI